MPTRFLSEDVLDLWEMDDEKRALLRELVNQDLADHCRQSVRYFLERMLREEQDWVLGYAAHDRLPNGHQRADHRNGCYHREIMTSVGVIRDLAVPRSRRGSYQTQILVRYQRRLAEVDQALRDLFLAGISQRRVGELAQELFGQTVSASVVSRLCQALDEQVRAFHSRPLADDLVYLYLDGIWMKVKAGRKVVKRVLLVALGIDRRGHKYIVDFNLAPRESRRHWGDFLQSLYQRGLHGAHLRCITTDGHKGLIGAVGEAFPWVKRQLCWVHKMRNVLNHLKKGERALAKAGMARIYDAATGKAALEQFESWYAHWHAIDAAAADCLKRDLEPLLTVFSLPPAHRKALRTNNPLERVNVEIRRRTKLIPAFTNDASCERICLSVVGRLQATWKRKPAIPITHKT